MAYAKDKILHKRGPATSNKWYADIPLSLISNQFKDFTIELQGFTIPRIEVGSKSIGYKGADFDVPSRVFNPGPKRIQFTYLIDQNWESYLNLYQWANCYDSIDNPTPDDKVTKNQSDLAWSVIPVHVHLLSPYRRDLMHVVYYGCMIKYFNELNVTYTETPVPVKHSFTISYHTVQIGHSNPLEKTANGGITSDR